MEVIKQLSNGIRVVLEPVEYLRSVAMGVYIKVGSAYEEQSNSGIAHMIEHMLFKGTFRRSAKQLAYEMALLGGDINAFTTKETTCFYGKVLDEEIMKLVDILADMITSSVIDEESLRKEKGIVLEEIDMYDDSPEDLVQEMVQKLVWDGNPLGFVISGEKKIVSNLKREDIIQFMKEHYVAENMVISVAGHFDIDKVVEEIENKFSKVSREKRKVCLDIPVFKPSIKYIDREIEQIHMCMAFNCVDYNSEEKYALTLVNSILGGSINSRLFQQVREEMGATYSIYSFGSSFEKAGLLQIYSAMNSNQVETVMGQIKFIIDDLISNGVTEEELLEVKQEVRSELLMSRESSKSIMSSNGKNMIHRGKVLPVSYLISKLEDVGMEEIHNFIKSYLKIGQAGITFVGDISSINVEKINKMWL